MPKKENAGVMLMEKNNQGDNPFKYLSEEEWEGINQAYNEFKPDLATPKIPTTMFSQGFKKAGVLRYDGLVFRTTTSSLKA